MKETERHKKDVDSLERATGQNTFFYDHLSLGKENFLRHATNLLAKLESNEVKHAAKAKH